MNKKNIRNYQIISFVFCIILGTLLHFTYKLSGENKIIGLLSAINESVWEHLKLVYFPMLISIIIGTLIFKKDYPNFFCLKTIGLIFSMFFIVIFFYTYSGILGKNIAIVDILSFFIAVFIGEFISYALIVNHFKCNKTISAIILIVLFTCFIVFTYSPPNFGIFADPLIKK